MFQKIKTLKTRFYKNNKNRKKHFLTSMTTSMTTYNLSCCIHCEVNWQ